MTAPDPDAPLSFGVHENALLVPTDSRSVYRNIPTAVFDAGLRPIEASLLTRSWTPPLITPPPDLSGFDPARADVVEEPHVYGGLFFHHFGHFLLESLARAWVVEEVGPLPFVWAAGGPPDPWQAAILERLDLTMPHRFPRRPTLFRRLILPQPGFRIQGAFHPRHAGFLARGDDGARRPGDAKLWLSREGVENPGRRSSGEARLQAGLSARGWRIFHPQEAPVAEQLSTLAQAGVAAGLEGSALHAAVLLERVPPMLALRHTNSRNYPAIAERVGFPEFELYGAFRSADRHDYRLARPEAWAGRLDALAEEILRLREDPAALAALKAEAEARWNPAAWRRRQALRRAPELLAATLRRQAGRGRRALAARLGTG